MRARCFLEVVERGTVAAAAQSLGYTAPAVSQQIGKLERSLGVPLFDRVSGRLRPTPAGSALVPHVYAVLDAMESGRESARTAAGAEREAVRVAAFPSAVVNLVAPLTADHRVPLGRVVEGEDDHTLRELRPRPRRRRDRPGAQPPARPARPAPALPPVDARSARPARPARPARTGVAGGDRRPALGGQRPWLALPDGDGAPLAPRRHRPHIAAEAYELSTLVALVAAGAGVAVLPRLGLPGDLRGARVVPGVSPVVRTLHAVTRRTAATAPSPWSSRRSRPGRRRSSPPARPGPGPDAGPPPRRGNSPPGPGCLCSRS